MIREDEFRNVSFFFPSCMFVHNSEKIYASVWTINFFFLFNKIFNFETVPYKFYQNLIVDFANTPHKRNIAILSNR